MFRFPSNVAQGPKQAFKSQDFIPPQNRIFSFIQIIHCPPCRNYLDRSASHIPLRCLFPFAITIVEWIPTKLRYLKALTPKHFWNHILNLDYSTVGRKFIDDSPNQVSFSHVHVCQSRLLTKYMASSKILLSSGTLSKAFISMLSLNTS